MSAKVTFIEKEKPTEAKAEAAPVVTVPKAALVSRAGKPTVFLVREGKAVARPVVAGLERGDQVVIKDGLLGGETIIVRPPESLGDGDGVRVKS
jgi:hypothetical protein